MNQLFNYCLVPEYETEILKSGKTLDEFIKSLGLGGVELMVYKNIPYFQSFVGYAVGVHLNYWPMWMPFYKRNKQILEKYFSTKEELMNYYGSTYYEGWLKTIRQNIASALQEKPEYLVWHVADCEFDECYTFNFRHSDEDVLLSAARVFNRVADQIPEDVAVLFENLWWPGLRLTDKEKVKLFFNAIKRKNVGIILDTGHLMNTNPELKTEEEGIEYVCRTIENLGEYASLIHGIHLNLSLSGEYVKTFKREYPQNANLEERYKHIIKIDQHRIYTNPKVQKIIDLVKPDYLVHELAYNDFIDFEAKIRAQKALCRNPAK